MSNLIPKKFKPVIEALAVGCIFMSLTMFFDLPIYMTVIIGVIGTVGGYRNSIKMDKEEDNKKAENTPKDTE